MMTNLFKKFLSICAMILDFLFPKPEVVIGIESLTPDAFVEKAGRAEPMPSSLSWISPMFSYQDPSVRQAIWELKYRGNKKIIGLLASILYAELASEYFDEALFESGVRSVLIPVPLSNKRRRERGFNQTELLVEALARLDSEKIFDYEYQAVKKNTHTKPQTELLTKKGRLKNLVGCFSVVNQEKVSGRNIILIDDVATTGATLSEIRKILLSAGAKTVRATVLAH